MIDRENKAITASSRPAVFVVQAVPDAALLELRAAARVTVFDASDRIITRDELLAGVLDSQYLWALGEVPVDAGVIDSAAGLRLIAIMEITSRSVDIAAATARGIPVTTLPNMDAVTTSTAEHTLGLMLALARRLPEGERQIRDGRWVQYQSMTIIGTRLAGSVLGIVGLGKVGRKLADRGRACDMQVIYADRRRLDPDVERELGVAWRTVDDLFREADFVALTPSLTASSRGLASADRLASMKPSAYLINTSRGAVLDEHALARILGEGRIAGAALDVFKTEPPTPGGGPIPELLELPNVILTPHLGTATLASRTDMARRVATGILDTIIGRRPADVINPEVFGEPARAPSERLA
jgi:glyoxylate reductase